MTLSSLFVKKICNIFTYNKLETKWLTFYKGLNWRSKKILHFCKKPIFSNIIFPSDHHHWDFLLLRHKSWMEMFPPPPPPPPLTRLEWFLTFLWFMPIRYRFRSSISKNQRISPRARATYTWQGPQKCIFFWLKICRKLPDTSKNNGQK